MFTYLLCIYKRPIILSLFQIDSLNFTMYQDRKKLFYDGGWQSKNVGQKIKKKNTG